MLDKLRNDLVISGWRPLLNIILIVAMLVGLFCSRSLLSAGMIGFVIVSFLHKNHGKQLHQFISTPLLWGMSLLFLLPFLSGFWSADKDQWMKVLSIKLPLLFFPLAFAGPQELSKKHWEWIASFFLALLLGSTIWTMIIYLSDPVTVNESYLKAKTMITPLENDHVRYSWLVSMGLLISVALFISNRRFNKRAYLLWLILAVWFLVFLHILSARTGLLSAYAMVLLAALWLILKKAKWIQGFFLVVLFSGLSFLAYKTIPSFQNKIKFFLYEKDYFDKTHYLPGATDAVRIISIKAGWYLMNESPWMGKGFGDISAETKKWYAAHYPQMIERDRIDPSSEWMTYGAGAGWPGFLAFSIAMLLPFFAPVRNKLTWFAVNAAAASGFLFDIGLETQFGVAIYALTILCWWKYLKP